MRRLGNGGPWLAAGIAVFAGVWLASGFYIVHEGEKAVVLRFGKMKETALPGPHWHLPYPFEAVIIVNVDNVRTIELGYRGKSQNKVPQESLMLTDDENIVDVQFAVQYTIADPEAYLFYNINPDAVVRQVAESVVREVVGQSQMDYVLYQGRQAIASEIKARMQSLLLNYQTGVRVAMVTMQNAQPPEAVQSAFDDAVKAGQDKERLINEAQAYANEVLPKAKGDAARIIAGSEGYRSRVAAEAKGDAGRFLEWLKAYKEAPEVTRSRLYFSALEDILAKNPKVFSFRAPLVVSSRPGSPKAMDVPEPEAAPQETPSIFDKGTRGQGLSAERERGGR